MIPLYYNRRSLFVRKVTTAASLFGIALVVFVFSTVIMLSAGIEKTLVATGYPDNAITLRKGSQAELMSGIEREAMNIMTVSPEIVSDAKGPLVTAEAVVLIVLDREGGGISNVTVRGVGPRSLDVHAGVKLAGGRMFEHGKREIVVGQKLGGRFKSTRLGDELKLGRDKWKVVGVLDSGGSGIDSEIWGSAEEIMVTFQRPVFSSVTARLKPGAFAAYQARLQGDQRLGVDVKTERQYYQDQSKNLSLFVSVLGIFVAVVFSMGAAIGAMITMYASVAARMREIGTLRAIGFSAGSVLVGFVIESIMLSLFGGAIGVALSSLMQLASFSTMNFDSFSEVVFKFHLSPGIVVASLVFSLVIGLVGGLAPAWRASRMKVVDAVRA